MQYTITVNQLAYQKHFPDLNFCHAAIVDWFGRLAHSGRTHRIDYDGNFFYWLQFWAKEELPILGLSKDSFWQIVEDLCNEKILKRHPADSAYFAFGDRYLLTFSEGDN